MNRSFEKESCEDWLAEGKDNFVMIPKTIVYVKFMALLDAKVTYFCSWVCQKVV